MKKQIDADADDWCVNCGKEVLSYYHRHCPWCGKVWWVKDDKVCRETDNAPEREHTDIGRY